MLENNSLKGIFVALVTPFDSQGRIMFESLQRHVEYLLSQKVDGFYVNGSTGESFLLSSSERTKIIEAVSEANEGKATIINHCGAIGTDKSIQLIKNSEKCGIDAISSVPPFYYGFSKNEVIGYYNDLANASELPFIVYNMPKFSNVVITPEIMAELRKNPHIVGLKFTHSDFYSMQQIKASDPELIIYNGFDEMAICGMAMGCDGAIGSTYNVIAPLIIRLRNLCRNNNFELASKLQSYINGLIADMTLHGKHFAIVKHIISKIEGIDYGCCRKPFSALNTEEIEVAEKLAAEISNMDQVLKSFNA